MEKRGETFITKKDFDVLKGSSKEKFANPRNAASGSLRQKNPEDTRKIPLKFIAYTFGYEKRMKIENQYEFLKKLNKEGIDLIRLISPTTTNERVSKILSSSSGYLYYISLKGVTGSELKVSDELEKRVLSIKEQTDLPVVVGFGIKDAITAKKMSSCSDGVVVGSLLVDEINKFSSKEDNIMNKKLTSIIDELKEGIA